MTDMERFRGAKIALLTDDGMIVLRRDDRPDIPYPGAVDLPGGLREGVECPMTCVRRETLEETGIDLPVSAFIWGRAFPREGFDEPEWFFVARLPAELADAARLMDEGQALWRESPAAYLARSDAMPHLQHMLQVYMAGDAGQTGPESGTLP